MKHRILLSAVLIFISSFVFAQETVTISGKILDSKKQPLAGANVLLKGTTTGATADAQGNFSLQVPKDAKTLVVSYIGFESKEVAIDAMNGNAVINVDLVSSDVALNQVVVSASKKKEKILDAPASISVIGQDRLDKNVVTSVVDELKNTPGVDIMRTGLVSSNVVIRGFNNIFSGEVLNVVDNRIGSVPSLRVNAYQLVPTSTLDYDKIEVVRGPASALYGPNATSGVVHIMTKSPLDQEKKFETTVAITSGFTVLDKSYRQYNNNSIISGNILNPEIRHSGKLFDGKFGYKISAGYFQGQDYPHLDSREPYTGDSLVFGTVRNGQVFTPDTLQKFTHDSAGRTYLDSARLDIRRYKQDFFIRKWNVDARIDIRPIKDITITFNGGVASSHNIELTGLGAGQAGGTGGWTYWYFQTRFKWKNLFVQYFINSSDAGNTYLIPQLSESSRQSYSSTSPPTPYPVQLLIDKSKLHGIQIQHSWNPIEKLGFVYGVDVLLTRPNTEGTINGRFENIDNLNQYGAYIQGDYSPLKWLKIVGAIRADYNSIIKNVAASPRAALVFKPSEGHNIRITYNRAFDSPNTLNQFLDLSNGIIPNGINIRGIGNPYGWNYNYDNQTGGVQFITAPWSGQGQWTTFGNNYVNAPMFDSLANYLVNGVAQNFAHLLGHAKPDANDYASAHGIIDAVFAGIKGPNGSVANATQQSIDYANFATTKDLPGSFQNVSNFKNLKKINNSYTQTVELGYKGLLFGKLSLQADVYWTRMTNYVSALKSASGAVVLDHNSYLGKYDSTGLLYQNLHGPNGASIEAILAGLDNNPSLQNHSIVPSMPGTVWDELTVLTYQFPMGTITPNDGKYVGSDYILTYQNLGKLDIYGIDFGFQYNVYDDPLHLVQFGGMVSWVDKDQLILSSGETVPLNAPKVKASATFDHTVKKPGLGYGLSFRYAMPYEGNSAIYMGHVNPMYVLDARISYRPAFYKGLLLSVNANNVTNYQWSSFPGVPKMGTQFYAKVQVTF